jgi:hypothetical protein
VVVTTDFAASGLLGGSADPPQPVASVTKSAVVTAAAAAIGPIRELGNGTPPTVTSSHIQAVRARSGSVSWKVLTNYDGL